MTTPYESHPFYLWTSISFFFFVFFSGVDVLKKYFRFPFKLHTNTDAMSWQWISTELNQLSLARQRHCKWLSNITTCWTHRKLPRSHRVFSTSFHLSWYCTLFLFLSLSPSLHFYLSHHLVLTKQPYVVTVLLILPRISTKKQSMTVLRNRNKARKILRDYFAFLYISTVHRQGASS